MTQKSFRQRPPVPEVADAIPTPERSTHGIVERLDRTISDASGRPARPYRFVDTLAVMERRGSITAGMRQAGEDFRECFAVAQLEPLSAFDISRPRIGNRGGFRSMEVAGVTNRERAQGSLACHPCRWRPRLSRRFMYMARGGMATISEGMGS
jgi:hypothetical protein